MPPTASNSQQAFQNLQTYQQGMKNPGDILQGYNDKLGVAGAQGQVSGLRQAITNTTNLLNQIPQGVMGRTQNSLVTQGQANRQIQNESAPVAQNLQTQGQQLGQQEGDLNNLRSQAFQSAGLDVTGQQNQLAGLKGIYDSLYGKEQGELQRQMEDRKFAEEQRQFNEQLSLSKSKANSGGAFSPNLLGGGGNPASATMSQRGDKGYNFVGANGKPISAAQYAQLKNIPFRDLLGEMAGKGDQGAKTALGFVGNDYGYDKSKLVAGVSSPAMLNLYKSLVWA